MSTIVPAAGDKQDDGRGKARPTPCPICGLVADNAIIVHGELTTTATFVDTEGHLFALVWSEVAA